MHSSSALGACPWGKATGEKKGKTIKLIFNCVASSSFDSTICLISFTFKSPQVIVFVYFVQSFCCNQQDREVIVNVF